MPPDVAYGPEREIEQARLNELGYNRPILEQLFIFYKNIIAKIFLIINSKNEQILVRDFVQFFLKNRLTKPASDRHQRKADSFRVVRTKTVRPIKKEQALRLAPRC